MFFIYLCIIFLNLSLSSDNQLELDREISLHGGMKKNKKKVPSKRITGFQFFPGDSDKLLVTSADSQIRIICGVDTICKLKKGFNHIYFLF